MKKVSLPTVLIVVGLIIVLLSPFTPDFVYNIVANYDVPEPLYDVNYSDIRTAFIIPSIRTAGILIILWGFLLEWKEK